MIKYEWDENKRIKNLQKHKVDFIDAKSLFNGYTLTVLDNRIPYGEQRFITLGLINERVFVVVHTEREESIRIISIRKATKNEQKMYFTEFPN